MLLPMTPLLAYFPLDLTPTRILTGTSTVMRYARIQHRQAVRVFCIITAIKVVTSSSLTQFRLMNNDVKPPFEFILDYYWTLCLKHLLVYPLF
jgi:uncharacterized protein (DUF1810 family)